MDAPETWRPAHGPGSRPHLRPGRAETSATSDRSGTAQAPAFAQRHYTVEQIAEMWNLSADTVRRIFERELGVLVIGHPQGRPGRRRYVTLRIPESVLERVHRRLSKV